MVIESSEQFDRSSTGGIVLGPYTTSLPQILAKSVSCHYHRPCSLTRNELHNLTHVDSRSAGVSAFGLFGALAPAINLESYESSELAVPPPQLKFSDSGTHIVHLMLPLHHRSHRIGTRQMADGA